MDDLGGFPLFLETPLQVSKKHCHHRVEIRRQVDKSTAKTGYQTSSRTYPPSLFSEDELSGCTITETKRKVFKFHETILSFGEPGSLGQSIQKTFSLK